MCNYCQKKGRRSKMARLNHRYKKAMKRQNRYAVRLAFKRAGY